MTRKARFWRIGFAVIAVLVIAGAVVGVIGIPITPYVQDKLTQFADEHFDSDLDFSAITVTLLPVSARVEKLVFRRKDNRDAPPLIRIGKATAYMSIGSIVSLLWSSTPSVRYVRLEGLEITIDRRAPKREKKESSSPPPSFEVEELNADGTVLKILPKDAWKDPMEYDLKTLHMKSVGLQQPMRFESVLTNDTPPGLIHTHGYFGPWSRDDAGDTPVRGEYTFDNADLGHFNGIGGILSSKGTFNGPLDRLVVDGYTDTPDFSVDVSGKPVHLKTQFRAIVDGTNGDTLLQPVTATFGNSKVVVHGGVYGIKGVKGKTVKLDVDVDDGRIEDMMRFAVKSDKPVLRGPIRYQAKMVIPPGKQRVVEKLILDGDFKVSNGQFTSPEVREKLGNLSNKAKGNPEAATPSNTASDFGGHFRLDQALLTLRNLTFHIPGADVHLDGSYHLLTEELDFQGKLELQAKLSETTTGIKSFFLKMADPLFHGKKGVGAEIPITIKGKRSAPKFGVDIGEVLTP